jgi:hypothetical protein
MTMTFYAYETLDAFVAQAMCDDEVAGAARGALSGVAPQLRDHLTTLGMRWDDKGVYIDSEIALDAANDIFEAIQEEYGTDSAPTWDRFDLGGDDDVDESGSIPQCVVNAIRDQ